jgi:hypothetical protein
MHTISEITPVNLSRGTQTVNLCEVPRNSTISPVFAAEVKIKFHHIDGAYSLCTLVGTDNVVHLSAFTDVFIWSAE